MIPVTKPYLPSREKLNSYIDGIYERGWLTNNGPLVQELTQRLEEYLGVENLLLVSNGTMALQIAYRTLGISGSEAPTEAITTPFTFVATASSLKWEGVQPVFVDVDPASWCMDSANIEKNITPNTRAIVPVHVFGNACDVEAIDKIAEKHSLKVIYDASHAFGVTYKGESLLKYGDAATLSFHATKLFHTGEGGAIVFKHNEDLERAKKMINFGITGPETIEELGINAKMSEMQAAMGLCVLKDIEKIFSYRSTRWKAYKEKLKNHYKLQRKNKHASNNYAYFPIVLPSADQSEKMLKKLKKIGVMGRKYFSPSLDIGTPHLCPNSRELSSKIICIPIYHDINIKTVEEITKTLTGKS